MKRLKIVNAQKRTELYIYEEIGDSWFGGVTAREVVNALKNAKDDVLVRINSPGGDVFEGLAIYNALAQSDKNITTQVDGLAASAASVVFMASNTRRMAENALLMIHEAWSVVAGNAKELRDRAEALDAISGSLAKIYVDATASDRSAVDAWMAAETWFGTADGDELEDGGVVRNAIADGFATEVIDNLKVAAMFDSNRHNFHHTPKRLVEPPRSKVANMKIEKVANWMNRRHTS